MVYYVGILEYVMPTMIELAMNTDGIQCTKSFKGKEI